MKLCVIAGGVGSARFCTGLIRVVDPDDLTIIVNTGDDERIRGLHISPDVDTVLYHLAGLTDWERGWGVDDESFVANDRYRELVERAGATPQRSGGANSEDMQEWFALGDRDIATHMLRTRLLDSGRSLTEATDVVRRGLGVSCRVLVMSDDPVRTVLFTTDGERLDFQEYFVHRQHDQEIARIAYDGAETAEPAPGVIEAISTSDVVLLPPSNPLLSIAPILEVPGISEAIDDGEATCVAVSPIVGGRALKGPADRILASFGHEVTAAGVAEIYGGLVDVFVVDESDRDIAARIETDIKGMRTLVLDTIMSGPEAAARLAKEILSDVG